MGRLLWAHIKHLQQLHLLHSNFKITTITANGIAFTCSVVFGVRNIGYNNITDVLDGRVQWPHFITVCHFCPHRNSERSRCTESELRSYCGCSCTKDAVNMCYINFMMHRNNIPNANRYGKGVCWSHNSSDQTKYHRFEQIRGWKFSAQAFAMRRFTLGKTNCPNGKTIERMRDEGKMRLYFRIWFNIDWKQFGVLVSQKRCRDCCKHRCACAASAFTIHTLTTCQLFHFIFTARHFWLSFLYVYCLDILRLHDLPFSPF